ncbi:MAG: hypothetical protein RUMPE_00555 [Eubacteriales bacterium SKADARSKE-1]|nr:hypothetical protein [Eubacteriales bacterium SKADARSKE-1]
MNINELSITLNLILIGLIIYALIMFSKYKQKQDSNSDTTEKLGKMISENLKNNIDNQTNLITEKLDSTQKIVFQSTKQNEERFKTFSIETEQRLDNIRRLMSEKLQNIREDNNKKLDEMRQVVDHKLQETLNKRMTESFKFVNDRLQDVYKGLGEMQSLAKGVGDLKKILSNVKSRGIIGEVQLGAILEEILSPEQYDKNVITKKNSRNAVEYAVKLPVEDGNFIYLPIDSKFPGDTYGHLRDAYNNGSQNEINCQLKILLDTIKREAKDIKEKYIDVPNTTDFAIMFLPFEGLYAEVVNRGMVEILQRDFHVNIAGPSTMAALLNSLQMGFRTFAIQKRSGEVWNVLGAVKTEFQKFSEVLAKTQERLNQASGELDKLVGVRTRQIQRRLKDVTKFPELEAKSILNLETEPDNEDILNNED